MNTKPFQRLRTALSVTLFLAMLVVLAGATVRATGSGMGCPDWPLCYGCWIPPVSVDQLPVGYEQTYAVAGRPAEFDAVKTWIEYINRLLGVVAGLALVAAAGLTLPVLRQRPSLGVVMLLSLASLAWVAWLGARVVDSFLVPAAVSQHLIAAYGYLASLLVQREIVGRAIDGPRPAVRRGIVRMMALVGLTFLAQWLLGIRTREEIEAWIWNHDLAETVFAALGESYSLHKVTAGLVGLATAGLAWWGWRGRAADPRLAQWTLWCFILVVVQALIGLVLWFGGLPSWAKPLHLLTATAAWVCWLAAVFHSVPARSSRAV